MRRQPQSLALFGSVLALILAAPGCGDDPVGSVIVDDPGFLTGQWCAIEIEGAAPEYVTPQQPCVVSTWSFGADGTYQWFLRAQPYYFLDGAGTYSLSGNVLTVNGIVANTLFASTPGNQDVISLEIVSSNTFRFRDDDQDRWTYRRQ